MPMALAEATLNAISQKQAWNAQHTLPEGFCCSLNTTQNQVQTGIQLSSSFTFLKACFLGRHSSRAAQIILCTSGTPLAPDFQLDKLSFIF